MRNIKSCQIWKIYKYQRWIQWFGEIFQIKIKRWMPGFRKLWLNSYQVCRRLFNNLLYFTNIRKRLRKNLYEGNSEAYYRCESFVIAFCLHLVSKEKTLSNLILTQNFMCFVSRHNLCLQPICLGTNLNARLNDLDGT